MSESKIKRITEAKRSDTESKQMQAANDMFDPFLDSLPEEKLLTAYLRFYAYLCRFCPIDRRADILSKVKEVMGCD